MKRRHFIFSSLAICLVQPGPARAAAMKPFDATAFQAAQQAGQSIVVQVHAPWWPICKKQQPIVDRLSQDPKFEKVTLFRIDFDSGKEHLRQLKVDKQATFVAFKGTTETARSTAETDAKALQKVFESTL